MELMLPVLFGKAHRIVCYLDLWIPAGAGQDAKLPVIVGYMVVLLWEAVVQALATS